MNDEKFVFFSDCKEKKSTAQSAFKRRTHTGKGGRVRFPSDNLSNKELRKMNGETKSYRLNQPMTFQEFKAMPDDVKVMYIKLLREKFNVPDRRIAEMMNAHPASLCHELKRLNLSAGQHTRGGSTRWDKESWNAWCGIASETADEPEAPTQEEAAPDVQALEIPVSIPEDIPEEEPQEQRAIPTYGNMVFDGLADDILETIRTLLTGANVHINITWDVL